MNDVLSGLIELVRPKSHEVSIFSCDCFAFVKATFKPQSPNSLIDLSAFVIGADADHGRGARWGDLMVEPAAAVFEEQCLTRRDLYPTDHFHDQKYLHEIDTLSV